MESKANMKFEDKEIQINIFESMEIDLKPTKEKKRRRVDDYDYNDPFLESFEGEFDVVELECKLENFFVYKGKIDGEPKRIAKKYNNSIKKVGLLDSIANIEHKPVPQPLHVLHFEFEKKLAKVLNTSVKYKKESKFENILIWMVFVEEPASEFERYLKQRALHLYDPSRFEKVSQLYDPSCFECCELKNEIENIFTNFLLIANNDNHFSSDKKTFNNFKEDAFIVEMLDFCIKYIKYYAAVTKESLQYIKNSALEYLNVMLPEQCTNKIRLKHYLSKVIHSRIINAGYDIDKVVIGEFVKADDGSLVKVEDEDESFIKAENESFIALHSSAADSSMNDLITSGSIKKINFKKKMPI